MVEYNALVESLDGFKREQRLAETRRKEVEEEKKELRATEENKKQSTQQELAKSYEKWREMVTDLLKSLNSADEFAKELAQKDKTFSEYVAAFCERYYEARGVPIHNFSFIGSGYCTSLEFKSEISLWLTKDFSFRLIAGNLEIHANMKVLDLKDIDCWYEKTIECGVWHIANWPDYVADEINSFLKSIQSPDHFLALLSDIDKKVNAPKSLDGLRELHRCYSPPDFMD